MGGQSVWEVHSVGSGELSYGVFCSPLGGMAQGGACRELGVVDSESSVSSE